MDQRRFLLFLFAASGLFLLHIYLTATLFPPEPEFPRDEMVVDVEPPPAPEDPPVEPEDPPEIEVDPPVEPPEVEVTPAVDIAEQAITLGSADPDSPYRMLVTLTNRGAAIARIELPHELAITRVELIGDEYHERGTPGGYIGHLTLDEQRRGRGMPVEVVGPGTPAAEAGVRPGDVILAVDGAPVSGAQSLRNILAEARLGDTVNLQVRRDGEEIRLPAHLRRPPLEVIRPERDDPLSLLLTLRQVDEERMVRDDAHQPEARRPADIERELPGVDLRTANWEVFYGYGIDEVPEAEGEGLRDGNRSDVVTFRHRLPDLGLEALKSYRLVQVPPDARDDRTFPGYHLDFEVALRNIGSEPRQVAYQLDGPTGLPFEGWWYAHKVGRRWGSVGVRDLAIQKDDGRFDLLGSKAIADGTFDAPFRDDPFAFIGVDAQYFSAVLRPERGEGAFPFEEWRAIRVGPYDPDLYMLTNVSFRLTSRVETLEPGGPPLRQQFQFFAGPKRPALLNQAEYGFGQLVYYGWFSFVARPMLGLLHFFHDYIVFNYGLAIILLTVLVRGCMFPLSLKQTRNMQKMQELQPEIRKLQEKHKKDMEARARAQQELFRKHSYNPLSGCLVVFLQLPIFIGLYRSLMVDIELRGAPLLTDLIRFASNLSAPDMLLDWSGIMPEFINRGVGIFGLGPYFNILPLVTVALFLWQQKKMMPPPADEQAAMQQKVMQYMMIFIGFLFYKVASGLCLYFIASTLWGIGERKLLPKAPQKSGGTAPGADRPPAPRPSPGGGSGGKRQRAKGRR